MAAASESANDLKKQEEGLTERPLDVSHPVGGHVYGDMSVPEDVQVGSQLANLPLEGVRPDHLFDRVQTTVRSVHLEELIVQYDNQLCR